MSDPRLPLYGPELIGQWVGNYRVEALVGQGGMGEVYRAYDQRLGRQVALKVPAPQLARDERFRLRFIRESRTVASIDHPHIIPVYEAGEDRGLLYIVMRYVEGRDLRALLDAEGTLPMARANLLFFQVASALDAAHEHGLVHRDVKPANILIAAGDPEHAYLTDFGLTKSVTSNAGLTIEGEILGTPRYVAPEQITGDRPIDARCDVYALACVVYETLAGVPPFQCDTTMGLLYAHVSDPPDPLTVHRPELPPAVDRVMARGLAKSPDERYGTCLGLVRELRDAMSADRPGLPATRRRRRPMLAGAAVLAAVAALIIALVVVLGGGGPATFPGSVAAPFTFTYPGSWQLRRYADQYVVASPEARRFEELFQTPVSPDWTRVNAIIREDPGQAQGMVAGVSSTLDVAGPAQDLQRSVQYLLPGTVSYTAGPAAATVSGRQAFRLDGMVSDPQRQGRLDFATYVVARDSGFAAYLTFFCAPDHCDRAQIDQILASVAFVKGSPSP
ncbi:MAG: Serine/threonine protein kinaselike protein [Actinomycetia bacterium]|nr:Serine/threonine protein kinaselike protein [Actinomycetes bacterium]